MAQFQKVNSQRGAPMGRAADGHLNLVKNSIRLFKVNIDGGGYDDGGAYWGLGAPLFCAIDSDGGQQFARAGSRLQAAVLLDLPRFALKVKSGYCDYIHAIIDGRSPNSANLENSELLALIQSNADTWIY